MTPPLRRHWRRWLATVAIMVGVSALLIWRDQLRQARAQALASEIQSIGGQVYADTTLMELVQRWCAGFRVNWKAGRMVTLFDVRFDSAWLREHDDLADLQIADLNFGRSTVTTEDSVRLIARHPLQTYAARGQRDADTIAAALGQCSQQTHLRLQESDLTDAGLHRLPLERVQGLSVGGTLVMAAGISELSRCRNLTDVSIDGYQLDERAVATLAELPSLERVTLIGPSVRDENVQYMAALKNLPFLQLQMTSVT